MRVALITGPCQPGRCGVGDYARHLTAGLRKCGLCVDVVDDGDWSVTRLSSLMRRVSRGRPDIVHFQYPSSGFAHRLGPHGVAMIQPGVVTIHEASKSHPLRKLSLYPFALRARHVIFTSYQERAFALRRAPWIASRSSVIPIGSNIASCPPCKVPRESREIVYFGLIMPNKGVEDVLALAALLKDEEKGSTVRIIGSHRSEHALYVARLHDRSEGLPVIWEQHLSEADVSRRLGGSRIAYLPYPDGSSERRGSLKAALASGMAVVTTRGLDTPPELEQVVKFSSSPREALGVIRALVGNPQEAESLGERARQYAARFSWERIAGQHVALYEHLLRASRAQRAGARSDPVTPPLPTVAPEVVTGNTDSPGIPIGRGVGGRGAPHRLGVRAARAHIGVNLSAAYGDFAGVGSYAFQLARCLPRIAPDVEWRFFGPDPHLAPELSQDNSKVFAAGKSGAARILWEQSILPLEALKERIDLLHCADFSQPVAYRRPAVNTIHDLSPFADPQFFPRAKRAYKQALIPLAARRSLAIITVSEFSRGEILNRFPFLEGRVFAIHHGVEPVTRLGRHEASPPFLLFVGTLENRKNIVPLIRAFRILKDRCRIPHRLVLVGKPGFGWKGIRATIRDNGTSEAVEVRGYVPQSEFVKLYQSASALVYPSVYEGFGLPLLEAMAHGTPVVCSNAASLPEVGGDAVVYFDPHNVEEMACAIERVLDSPSLQADLRAKGLKRAAAFTWEECARKHIEVYRKVLG